MTPYISIPLIPGPVTLHPMVRYAMARDYGSGQLEEAFWDLYAEAGQHLATLMETRNDIVIMTGEGMIALWGALKSTLLPGDRVLSIVTGVFGDGIGDMAKGLGCEVMKVSFGFDETIGDLDRIEDAVKTFAPKMITVVHCETPSGTLNPIDGIGEIKRRHGVPLLYVDAVASVGGVPVTTDTWGADLVLGGAQKCLSAPPSTAFLSVSEAAWDVAAAVGYAGYDALMPFWNLHDQGRFPYTPYWHGVAALNAGAKAILDEGMAACFARHKEVAQLCRDGLMDLGFDLFPVPGANPSPTVTAVRIPAGYSWPLWRETLYENGLAVAGSFGPMAEKVFRLGHMGCQATPAIVEDALSVLAACMEDI